MIRFFAAHPTAANLMMLAIVAAGLLSVPNLRRETFPDFAPTEVGIEVEYRGASAEDVEQAICQRLGDALEGLTDLHEIRCAARQGLASAVAEMEPGGEPGRFLDDVKTEVDAIDDLPAEAEAPVVRELNRTELVAALAVWGPMSAPDLKSYAESLKDRLLALPQVSQVDIHGFADRQLHIEVPRRTLRELGLSASALAETVARQGVDLPAGLLETARQDVLVRFADEPVSPRDLEDLVVVAAGSGAEIRLGDIARIEDRFEDRQPKILVDDQRAAVLEVRKTKEEDTLEVIEAVRELVTAERARAPPTVGLAISQDISSIVADRLSMLLENGVLGLLLVFVAMAMFFRLRFAFWVVVGLPVSFLGTLFVMAVVGYSIDMITMVGLLLAIGLLMDDAIVLSENVAARLGEGGEPLDAVVDGVRQVAPGVVSSFITTVCVFGPLSFLSGDIGRILQVLPVVLIVTLAVSLIEAFLILPHHLVRPVARMAREEPSRFRQGFEARFEWVRERVLGRLVDLAVARRYVFLGLLIVALLATVGLVAGGRVKFEAIPEIEGDVIEARVLLPQGTPLARTEQVVAEILAGLEAMDAEFAPRQPQGQSLVRVVQARYGDNPTAAEVGPHVARVIVDLLPAEARTVSLDTIYARWREAIGPLPDVISLNLQEPLVGPQGRAIEIRLRGEDLQELRDASLALQDWLRGYQGVHDVLDDLRPGKPERRLHLREGALVLELDAATIAGQLRSALLGRLAMEVQVGEESYEIEITQQAEDRDSLEDLEEFTVLAPGGAQVPLEVAAVVAVDRGWARIHRIDGRRTVTVQGDVDVREGNAMAIIADTRARFLPRLRDQFPGVEISIQGQSQEAATTGASIRRGFLLGLLAVFVVLSFQFRGYVDPLVVMTAIPFAIVGALWGHVLTGYDLSMPSLVGAASLAGVVVNDSILLVHFVRMRAREGRSIPEAAAQASRDRFRAVLLTSLTTILGLLPLLAESSVQAQILKPLVVSVVFGLLASTVLVLLAIPAFFSILADFEAGKVAAEAPG